MNDTSASNALDYTRRLHKEVSDWYTSADNKAQILLTLNGLLLGFLGSAAFWSGENIENAVQKAGHETLFFFVAFLFSLAASITSALMCLKSRLRRHEEDAVLPPTAENLWFFQLLPAINPREFANELHGVKAEREIEILSSQIQILSFNVINKHVWFNYGFKFFVVSLLCFIMVIASYFIRLYAGISDPFSPALTLASIVVVVVATLLYRWLDRRDEDSAKRFQDKVSSV